MVGRLFADELLKVLWTSSTCGPTCAADDFWSCPGVRIVITHVSATHFQPVVSCIFWTWLSTLHTVSIHESRCILPHRPPHQHTQRFAIAHITNL